MSDTEGPVRRGIGRGLAALLGADRTMDRLRTFSEYGSAVTAFVDERCVGENPGFVTFDAANRLIVADSMTDPSVVVVVTPESDGYVVTAVAATERPAPLVAAMDHRSAHPVELGSFPTPEEAFSAGLAFMDAPDPVAPSMGPSPGM